MNKVIAFTQYRENYGDEQNPHWKNKGGSAYVVAENVTDLTDPNLVPPEIAKRVVWRNPMSESYIIGMEVIKSENIKDSMNSGGKGYSKKLEDFEDAAMWDNDMNDVLRVTELDGSETVLVLHPKE